MSSRLAGGEAPEEDGLKNTPTHTQTHTHTRTNTPMQVLKAGGKLPKKMDLTKCFRLAYDIIEKKVRIRVGVGVGAR